MSSALNINLPLNGGVGLGVGVTDASIGGAAPSGNMRDNRWLTLEVCREFQRAKCSRSEQECKYAHPPPHVEVQNGRVTCCFDSIKGKCNRKDPPCKYLHPPAHLKEQLLQNGRNNLVARSMVMQQMHLLQQLSGNPAASGSSNVPVMYPSSTTLTTPSAVLTPASSLYPSAYLNPATLGTSLNGSPSPTGTVSASSPDVTNALQSALLNASSQQSANASSAASNQLVAALLGQLASGSSSPNSAAQQQQQYRALQVQALLQAAAQQKQLFAATGVSPSASNAALLSGGVALCGLPNGATLASLQSLGALQNGTLGLSALSNGGLTMQNGMNHAAASSQPGSNASGDATGTNSANALLQSLSAYGSNGSQQRNSNEQFADSSSASGSRKRSHAESPSSATAPPASCSTANPSSGTALTGSSTNAYDLLPLDQNQLLLAAASGVPSSLSAKRVASVDARTGLPCYNPATQSQAVTMYPSSVPNAVNVNIVPSQTASLSGYQHALLAALSGLATTSTLPTAPQQSSTAALLQQPNSLAYAQPAGLSIAKMMTGSNGTSSLATLPPRF